MTLPLELRKRLERAIVDARVAAEFAARAALEALAVQPREPYQHMAEPERRLRRRLRTHARQLGDRRDAESGTQAIELLVQECAYEHWHGMLFARFLAENDLLIEPEMAVPVTLEECDELAEAHGGTSRSGDEGVDKWTLAVRFAHAMLPQVFRADLPVHEVRFAEEHRQRLEALVDGLPAEVFCATDALGWVYQFWQSQKKAEVNASETKIGAAELPAVTQLFTEPYMVSFLLDNSLGAWWAARRLTEADLNTAQSEAELRQRAAIPGLPLEYLRFVREGDAGGPWRVAAGGFDSWPEDLAQLKVLDPCCGSGHFLTVAFAMLVPMRMALGGLPASEAVDAVLRQNLHGLEIDARCVEIAVFSLAMAAWRHPGAGGYRPLPGLNVACSGLSVGATKEQWAALATGRRNLRIAMNWLHDLFKDAPTLGSLLDPAGTEAAKLVDWREISGLLTEALALRESDLARETALAASGLAKAAELLSQRYHLVATNVPYLARGKQSERLKQFCAGYRAAKKDLATVFLERCLSLCEVGGTASLVLPQNWLFLTSYKKLRERLLKRESWHLLARLGEHGFESSAAAGAFVALLTLSRRPPASLALRLMERDSGLSAMCGLDVSMCDTASAKSVGLRSSPLEQSHQLRQLDNPDARVVLALEGHRSPQALRDLTNAYQGVASGDYARFGRLYWELPVVDGTEWVFQQSTADVTTHFSGREHVLRWSNGDGALANSPAARVQGLEAWGRLGVAAAQMRSLPVALHSASAFDNNCAAIIPWREEHLPAIWCFCSSPDYHEAVRRIDQKINVTNATLAKVPFDLDHWSAVASREYPNGLPKPYSNDPTQWVFHGHPCHSVRWDDSCKRTIRAPARTDATVLQVAVARILGYRWPAEQDPDMELAVEQRECVRACEPLLALADGDGIVCIPAVRGEQPAADRLQAALATAYEDAWDEGVRTQLLADADATTLDDWLRNRFFEQHCKLFHNRPFIWHVWDGREDGFHALVNHHKLAAPDGQGRRCLESLTYSYLGDWITRQQDAADREDPGAEDRLAAALALQKRLAAILIGEPPHDIFVRWKPLTEQPIGWEPDINDGIRLNIRPFMMDDIPGGKKGAGVLRTKPKVHWRKDRGKEPHQEHAQYPWFWHSGVFTEAGVTEIYTSRASKAGHASEVLNASESETRVTRPDEEAHK